jgi:hypothetical protein
MSDDTQSRQSKMLSPHGWSALGTVLGAIGTVLAALVAALAYFYPTKVEIAPQSKIELQSSETPAKTPKTDIQTASSPSASAQPAPTDNSETIPDKKDWSHDAQPETSGGTIESYKGESQ